MSAYVSSVSLFRCIIVLDGAVREVALEFTRGREVTETVIVADVITTFDVRYPVRSRTAA